MITDTMVINIFPLDMEVTEDMCVTHFLIQPDPEGVKLQGWNEPAFSKRYHI